MAKERQVKGKQAERASEAGEAQMKRRDGERGAQRHVAWQRTDRVLPQTQEEPEAIPTVVGNSEQGNSRRENNNTKRQGRQVCCDSTRKVANHREREAGPKNRVDVKQAELTGSMTC